ncbi:hypothetical protein HK405_010794 [Cladochytrium tenue]|nr:hypothetical protein HK405_010794 [Cladochytrium tenue]
MATAEHQPLLDPDVDDAAVGAEAGGGGGDALVQRIHTWYRTHAHPPLAAAAVAVVPAPLLRRDPAAMRWALASALAALGLTLSLALVNTAPPPPLGARVDLASVAASLDAFAAAAASGSAIPPAATADIAAVRGNRAVGWPGFDLSVDVVVDAIRADPHVTCEPVVQEFQVPTMLYADVARPVLLRQVQPFVLDLFGGTSGTFAFYHLGGPADISAARLVLVDEPCAPDSWVWFPPGAVALAELTAGCGIEAISARAEVSLATAVILLPAASRAQLGLLGTEGALMEDDLEAGMAAFKKSLASSPRETPVAVLVDASGTLSVLKAQLDASVKVKVDIAILGEYRNVTAKNVICETTEGNPNNTIVIGAHIDGVPFGPGIDDNASGSATLLELLQALYRGGYHRRLRNRVRFCWWGAEELGLLGSYHYVNSLSPAELAAVALNINLDMLAAPNGWPRLGDPDSLPPGPVREATHAADRVAAPILAAAVAAAVKSAGLRAGSQPFGRDLLAAGSDHFPFLEAGVPSVSLATGASHVASAADRTRFGAVAGAPADPCYHRACDTRDNVDQALLRAMAVAAANILQVFAEAPDLRGTVRSPLRAV